MAPIHDAAEVGDVETLRRLLAEGVSPNAIDWSGGDFETRRTPLHVLCRSPATMSPRDNYSKYHEAYAAARGEGFAPADAMRRAAAAVGDFVNDRTRRVACFKLLRDAGANLGATDAIDYTPLHFAASRADVEIVSLLIQAGVNVNVTSRDGFTPLHEAARNLFGSAVGSAADCVDLLIKAGAAVNVKASGWTPLALALNGGHRRMLPLFLRAGAEIPGYYSPMPNPYILRVQSAGGFEKFLQAHLARVTKIFESTLGLDARPARLVAEFWLLHAGYYWPSPPSRRRCACLMFTRIY